MLYSKRTCGQSGLFPKSTLLSGGLRHSRKGLVLVRAQQAMQNTPNLAHHVSPELLVNLPPPTANIHWHCGAVSRTEKENLLQQRGCVVWFTGLSGSGKSTVACTLEHALHQQGRLTALLDGDNIRHGLNNNLGFSPADRVENIRRIGEVAKLMANSGVITLASFISPYKADRDLVRANLGSGDFIEVHMKIPLEVCEARDPKGLYKLARAGKLKCFTGVDDPYEEPVNPEVVLELRTPGNDFNTPEMMARTLLQYMESNGYLNPPA